MNKIIAFVLASFFTVSTVQAEEHFKNLSLGLGVGPTIGAGFTGRYDWESGWGIQAAALPYYTNDNAFMVEGLTTLYTLDRNRHGSVYLSMGFVGWHKMVTNYIWPVVENKIDANGNPVPVTAVDPIITKTWSNGFASGPGLGFKFNFFENYTVSFDLPAAFVFEIKNGKAVFDSFRPWPNVALMYSF
jgi:hypothetical protein